MKRNKILFIFPLFLSLLVGCSNIKIKYYKDDTTNQGENKTDINEDFFGNSQTTYTDNIESKTLEDLYQICKKATVTVEIYTTSTQGLQEQTLLYSSGSGFIAKESESYLFIYTNAHVIDSSKKSFEIEVVLSDYTRHKAAIVAKDTNEDVGIIKIKKPETNNYLVASLADSSKVSPGQQVFAIGAPLGIDFASSITTGIISGVNIAMNETQDSKTMYLLQTDTAINPGNSGGPLFNLNGEVVGINTLKLLKSESDIDVEGMGFAIPMNHFNLVAETIIKGETYTRPLIGIQINSISHLPLKLREEYNICLQYGLYIAKVENPNSQLIEKTIITHINDKKVITLDDFSIELYKYKKGDNITITYTNLDGTNPTTVTITLN